MKKLFYFLICVALFPLTGIAQGDTTVYRLYRDRDNLEYRLNKMVINKNLALPLNDSTEGNWQSTFFALQYLNRTDFWSKSRLAMAVTDMHKRSADFQRALLEVIYNLYPNDFRNEVSSQLSAFTNRKSWSMAVEYLLQHANADEGRALEKMWKHAFAQQPDDPWLNGMQLSFTYQPATPEQLAAFFKKDFLPAQVLMISIQRKNRDYPGLVVIRDTAGNFLRDANGKLIAIPQLARSLSGLPGYLTNGNTPQGVLRMDGFDVSKAGAIGPTRNVQLSLPFEWSSHHFMRDSTLTDTIIRKEMYTRLLPSSLRHFTPMYEAFYAGMAGRHEIIAHGTTVKPEYYKNKPWYPFTPTLGCLCTDERWDDKTQLRISSDQETLIAAITTAGGPQGYALVINLNDDARAVTPEEAEQLLRLAGNE